MSMLALLFFPLMLAIAAFSDLFTMKISNKLVLLLTVGFLVVSLVVEMPLQQFAMHVLCALVVLVVGFGLFALRWIGGGDAKLAAATTLWLGFGLTLPYVVYAALFGGVLTILFLVFRGLPMPVPAGRYAWFDRLRDRKSGIPYGVALALAGLMIYTNTGIYERLIA
ncbi:MAG: prepilin peptidase [Devosia sp.]|uniref:A24 family peptidase n=1 Tax=Devosia sp. TaxID=1871048 RepID=UPI0024C99E79|nr:prepilin peptidase [Devosia sp.]UYN99337.1 MAG: prepilin peptidase [Devosia sp.]